MPFEIKSLDEEIKALAISKAREVVIEHNQIEPGEEACFEAEMKEYTVTSIQEGIATLIDGTGIIMQIEVQELFRRSDAQRFMRSEKRIIRQDARIRNQRRSL